MQTLARNPAAAYRRVALDARIEASGGAALARICLEEAEAALGRAAAAVARACAGHGGVVPTSRTGHREPLSRAQSIMLWLARSVPPAHPLHASLTLFYGALASQIGANLQQPDAASIEAIRRDIRDIVEAAG